ncbi:VOC family protein [Halobacillus salinus]|uniref:VOC domain-containing protein n=1 Tax=Halobacillus salinus TaxID=192814 RepID=A0A4Z0H034_9BACI|nr:VOC family protein [Halobacillus salinus]TGB03822.1 hypothetical protein E4663_02090 [Halobacillus salinus]
MKVHHLGVPVEELTSSVDIYERLGFQVVKRFTLGEEKIAFMEKNEWLVELIESPDSLQGHICLEVKDASEIPAEAVWIEGPFRMDDWSSSFYQLGEEVIEWLIVEETKRG